MIKLAWKCSWHKAIRRIWFSNYNSNSYFHWHCTPANGLHCTCGWLIKIHEGHPSIVIAVPCMYTLHIYLIVAARYFNHAPFMDLQHRSLTLKLLCTKVSSKSITMHFLCMSECLTGCSKYLGWPCKGGGVIVPSIGVPFWFVFVLTLLQQQNIEWRKLRFDGFSLSSSSVEGEKKKPETRN